MLKICVLLKQVPDQGSVVAINASKTWIEENNLVFATNESDTYALEEALLLKESVGGEVVTCTLGPPRASQILKDALAKGADRALFLRDEAFDTLDSLAVAKVLGATLADESFDLILCGLQTDDTGEGQLGPMLAERLNVPHVTLAVQTELGDGVIKVKQELEGGWFREVAADLPALVTIQSGINSPRYASLKGIMAMKKKEIKELSLQDIGLAADTLAPRQTVQRLYRPARSKQTTYLEGSPDEIVAQLVDKLAHEAQVI